MTQPSINSTKAPSWWRVEPEAINSQVRSLRRGRAWKLTDSAGGRGVWACAFGGERAEPGTATWASASNSRNTAAYDTHSAGDDNRQVVVLVGGVHGAEPEAVVGILNLASLLDTGRDLRGHGRPHLLDLARHYRLVLLPCVNMDGRAVSPDHLHDADERAFRRASQGVWSDGTLVGYPACKEYAPLPLDRVGHPGGYPNAAGYNIMHDACPGDLRTPEAAAVLKLVADEQADLILHLHSHLDGGQVLGAPLLAYPLHVARTTAYQGRVHAALDAAGLRPAPVLPPESRMGLSLAVATTLASGGLSVTFEQSCLGGWSSQESLETFYVTLEVFLTWGLLEPFSPRSAVARGLTR